MKNSINEVTMPSSDYAYINKNTDYKSDENVILLKGRTKKIPRTINYNELFVNTLSEKSENNCKQNMLANDLNKNKNYYNAFDNMKNDTSSNFEDFFDKINQNKKVLEILNQKTDKLNIYSNYQHK